MQLSAKESRSVILCLRPEVVARIQDEEEEADDADHSEQSIDFRALVSVAVEGSAPLSSSKPQETSIKVRAFLVRSVVKASITEVRGLLLLLFVFLLISPSLF